MKKIVLLGLATLVMGNVQARCFSDQSLRDDSIHALEEVGFECKFLNKDEAFSLENKPQLWSCTKEDEGQSKNYTVKVESTLLYEPGLLGPCWSAKEVKISR